MPDGHAAVSVEIRVLCSGENEAVRIAVGRPSIVDRGVRILSMDGGGMKVQLSFDSHETGKRNLMGSFRTNT